MFGSKTDYWTNSMNMIYVNIVGSSRLKPIYVF